MRICIFGAGAVGAHLAARLAAAGHEVSVVARGAHREAMLRDGVRLLHADEVIAGPVREPHGPQDIVIVALKANALGVFADAAAPLLGPRTAVVFAQNGVPWWYSADLPRLDPHGKLKRAIPRESIVGAVVYSANEVVQPGVVRNLVPNNNMLVIGEPDNRNGEAVRALRTALEAAGMPSPAPVDIRDSVWAKLAQNVGNSTLCLLADAAVSQVAGDSALHELGLRMRDEVRAVAAALGVDVARAPQRPSGGHSAGAVAHKPSILQDYERGRPMEVEAQLLAPLALARLAGAATPTLDLLIPIAARKAAAKGLYP